MRMIVRLGNALLIASGQAPFRAAPADAANPHDALWIVADAGGSNALAFGDGVRACLYQQNQAQAAAGYLNAEARPA